MSSKRSGKSQRRSKYRPANNNQLFRQKKLCTPEKVFVAEMMREWEERIIYAHTASHSNLASLLKTRRSNMFWCRSSSELTHSSWLAIVAIAVVAAARMLLLSTSWLLTMIIYKLLEIWVEWGLRGERCDGEDIMIPGWFEVTVVINTEACGDRHVVVVNHQRSIALFSLLCAQPNKAAASKCIQIAFLT